MRSVSNTWSKAAAGLAILSQITAGLAMAAAPTLRDEISLNGTWTTGGQVPQVRGITIAGTTPYVYERSVTVPAGWTGKTIKLFIDGINYSSDIFINGAKISSTAGGWIPFTIDITPYVQAGAAFTLRCEVKGSLAPPTYVNGTLMWPIGAEVESVAGRYSGITGDVLLRAYGTVSINDAFIRTSTRNKTIDVDYIVRNNGSQSRTVTIRGDITPSNGASVVKTITSNSITLAAGQADTVTVNSTWTDALLWWPDKPNLYHLISQVLDGTTVVDQETRRFGFREVWASGNKYMLNGIRVNFHGDNRGQDSYGSLVTPAGWSTIIDQMKAANMNVMRFHMRPAPTYTLDIADEKGFMLIEESNLYGQTGGYSSANSATLLANAKILAAAWIRGHRNHPSIIRWSSGNETVFIYAIYSAGQMKELCNYMLTLDPTRPISCDGDRDFGWNTLDWHYLEGYDVSPVGSIYQWNTKVSPSRPTGTGEWCTSYGPADNVWCQGTYTRGYRYGNWADIRPYTCGWVLSSATQGAGLNFVKSFAAVALFDKAYDGLGIAPVKSGTYPSVAAGSQLNRTLVLYNDEFRDTNVTIQVDIVAGGTTYASATKGYLLPLGYHLDIACGFQVPNVGGSTFDLVLTTKKGGVTKFTESKRFNVTGASSGTSSNAVTLGDAVVPVVGPKFGSNRQRAPRIERGGIADASAVFDLRGRATGSHLVHEADYPETAGNISIVRRADGSCERHLSMR